jgi:hypothetical protein
MAWEPTNPVRGNARWWAVHPILGDTIMSTNAVALARAYDLEIVTSDGPIHQSLLGTNAEGVYDMLVRQQVCGMQRSNTEKGDDLLRFVVISRFDLDKLSVEDIAELNRKRNDLSALKSALLAQVEDVGAMPDREVWHDVLSVRTKDVVEEWGARASILSAFSRGDAKELTKEFKNVLQDVAPALVAGGATIALVGALPGLAVGAVFGTVHLMKKWQESKRPYRFLSCLARSAARSHHFLEASPA